MLVRKQEKRLYSNELEVLVTSLEKLKHNSLLTYYVIMIIFIIFFQP